MSTRWLSVTTNSVVDTATGGITQNGVYYLLRNTLDLRRPCAFGASVRLPGHTATVQLFAEVAGARVNLGTALTPTNGAPVAGADEYTLTGDRGIIVSGIVGTVYPEVVQ